MEVANPGSLYQVVHFHAAGFGRGGILPRQPNAATTAYGCQGCQNLWLPKCLFSGCGGIWPEHKPDRARPDLCFRCDLIPKMAVQFHEGRHLRIQPYTAG